ncbi:MAG TPA: RidA family protein [Bauldia sp.]|nr:RidA family protein [Bauldia sp.]
MPTHKRIRPYNVLNLYPEMNIDHDLCQAVVANGVVYMRGQIGQNLETGESVGIGDVVAQTEQAMSNIKTLLEEAGSSLDDIVKLVIYTIDPRYREEAIRVMGRWLKGVYPVTTGVVVSMLGHREWVVEIDATAVISDPKKARARRPTKRKG